MHPNYSKSQDHSVDSATSSEMPSTLKATSIVALAASILGTLWGSIALNPLPPVTANESTTVTETVVTSSPDLQETPASTTLVPVETPKPIAAATPEITATPTTTELTPSTSATTESTILDSEAKTTTTSPSPATTAAKLETTTSPAPTVSPDATPISAETSAPVATSSSSTETPKVSTDSTSASTSTPMPDTATKPQTSTAAVDVTQLSQTVYDKLDQEWTKKNTPVTEDSAYLLQVTPEGAIAQVEPQSEVAKQNLDNTPLPGLVKMGTTTASGKETTQFEVKFTADGLLEIKPVQ
ncbi:MAG: hypothetical protein ACRC8A_18695 [Microcoleaceae cyanobacterium]